MVKSSRLLLTSYGGLKAIELSDGYHEIVRYRSFPIGDGWYFIECEYGQRVQRADLGPV